MADIKAEPAQIIPLANFGSGFCQCCMKSTVLMSLLEVPEGASVPLYEMIKFVFVLEVKKNGFICGYCLEELYRSYRFKVNITETQKLFEQAEHKQERLIVEEISNVDDDFDSHTEHFIATGVENQQEVPPEDKQKIEMLDLPIQAKIEFDPHAPTVLYKRKTVSPERVLRIPVELALEINRTKGGETPKSTKLPYKIDRSTLICAVCKEKHKSYDSLRIHMTTHFEQWICEECGKVCPSRYNLLQHKRTHSQKDHECPHCDKKFRKYQLQTHIDMVHFKCVIYKCPYCSITFKTYHLKAKHIREDHKDKALSYECTICFKQFCTASSLTSHMKSVHINIRNISCDQCDAMFQTKCQLKRHYYTHNTERNFQCDQCHKSYKTPHHLSGHIKSHHKREIPSRQDKSLSSYCANDDNSSSVNYQNLPICSNGVPS